MPNNWFQFKQFKVEQDKCAMKIGTDSILLGAWADCNGVKTTLDIGTGTGILALMIAQKCDAEIIAIDIDKSSIIEAEENVKNSPWANRIKLYNVSLQLFNSTILKYDFIILNPPFFYNSLKSENNNRSLARHADTLSHGDIINFCKEHLALTGKLTIIFPIEQGNNFIKLCSNIGLNCNRLCKVKPNPEKPPHRLLLEFSFQNQPLVETEITLETGVRHHYTDEYKELTKDFYMHFKY